MSELARADVIIAGAGPAGLAAAFACQDEGLKPVVADTSKTASAAAAKGRSAALFNNTVAFLHKAWRLGGVPGRRRAAEDAAIH